MSTKYFLDNTGDLEEELDELEDAEVREMGTEEILASKRLEKEELGFEDTEPEEEMSELLRDDNENEEEI